jgi:hypothetical protein
MIQQLRLSGTNNGHDDMHMRCGNAKQMRWWAQYTYTLIHCSPTRVDGADTDMHTQHRKGPTIAHEHMTTRHADDQCTNTMTPNPWLVGHAPPCTHPRLALHSKPPTQTHDGILRMMPMSKTGTRSNKQLADDSSRAKRTYEKSLQLARVNGRLLLETQINVYNNMRPPIPSHIQSHLHTHTPR